LISIIIPVLNEEKNVGRLISQIKESSVGYINEIVVADGGSTDRTIDIAREMGAITLLCSKKGRGVQMNEGASITKGEILYFLHADTILPDGFDRLIVQAYNNGNKSGCFRLRFDDTHWALRLYSWFTRFETTLVRFGDQSLYVEKTLFDNVGGFNKDLIVMEDQELVKRIRAKSSFKLFKEYVVTSSRKYQDNGIFWLQIIFVLIFLMYHAGARQETLVHLYKSLIKNLKI